MKNKHQSLSWRQSTVIGSMLFGLFFGAGNLIFPVQMGQEAGANLWPAALGFVVTAVGLPLLSVVAIGVSGSKGLNDMSERVLPKYGHIFTALLYIVLGPLLSIPRTATVSYEIGFSQFNQHPALLFAYSVFFFLCVAYFSLKPSGIMTWVGKWMNPVFLIFLATILAGVLLTGDTFSFADFPVAPKYQEAPFLQGFLNGYNTMDVIAGLIFGILVVRSIHQVGVTEDRDVAMGTIKSGALSMGLMAVIYFLLTMLGARSLEDIGLAQNGGETLIQIVATKFGIFAGILLFLVMFVACLKTAIGLIVSCAETFAEIYPHILNQEKWTYVFIGISFIIANAGLDAILAWAVPFLAFMYPLSIVIALLHLVPAWSKRPVIMRWTLAFTLVPACFDLQHALPTGSIPILDQIATAIFPFYSYGFAWVLPAILGLLIGLVHSYVIRKD